MKTTTHYRNRVATEGSAAYGNGRIDNKEEKKQDVRRLKIYARGEMQNRKFKMSKNTTERTRAELTLELIRALEKLHIWKSDVLRITPRYFKAFFDNEHDSIKIQFLSELQNVEKYYLQINVIKTKEEIKKMIEEIRTAKLLSDESYTIEISKQQFVDFVNNDLKGLKTKIENAINQPEPYEERDEGKDGADAIKD